MTIFLAQCGNMDMLCVNESIYIYISGLISGIFIKCVQLPASTNMLRPCSPSFPKPGQRCAQRPVARVWCWKCMASGLGRGPIPAGALRRRGRLTGPAPNRLCSPGPGCGPSSLSSCSGSYWQRKDRKKRTKKVGCSQTKPVL